MYNSDNYNGTIDIMAWYSLRESHVAGSPYNVKYLTKYTPVSTCVEDDYILCYEKLKTVWSIHYLICVI